MAIQYVIEELTRKGKILHDPVFSKAEADAKAVTIHRRTGNPVSYRAEYISGKTETVEKRFVEVSA